MKKIVCCAAVVFGMMETSQGMKMKPMVWSGKTKEQIKEEIRERLENTNLASMRAAFVCPDVIKHFIIKDGRICNISDENEVLKFDKIDFCEECAMQEFEKEELEMQEALKNSGIKRK